MLCGGMMKEGGMVVVAIKGMERSLDFSQAPSPGVRAEILPRWLRARA